MNPLSQILFDIWRKGPVLDLHIRILRTCVGHVRRTQNFEGRGIFRSSYFETPQNSALYARSCRYVQRFSLVFTHLSAVADGRSRWGRNKIRKLASIAAGLRILFLPISWQTNFLSPACRLGIQAFMRRVCDYEGRGLPMIMSLQEDNRSSPLEGSRVDWVKPRGENHINLGLPVYLRENYEWRR